MIAVAALVIAPVAAHAQHTKGTASGRIAGIAPPPVVVVVNQVFMRGTFLTGAVPIIVSTDGRVFANFGGGFEQVVTACGVSTGVVVTNELSTGLVQPGVVQPSVIQPGIVPSLLPFVSAIPNQQTESQQLRGHPVVPMQTQQQVVVGNRACWSTDGRGQVFVGRQ
jgi:hypothetical protein